MPGHPFGQSSVNMKSLVETIRIKLKQRFISKSYPVHIISPINKRPAPDHNGKHRKIDPVEPAYSQRVFFFEAFHLSGKSKNYLGICKFENLGMAGTVSLYGFVVLY